MPPNPIHGNPGGSWSGGHSTPTPPMSQQPIVSAPPQTPKQTKFTEFEYEGWTIHFQEFAPFAWYVDHICTPNQRKAAVDDKNMTIHFDQKRINALDKTVYPEDDQTETSIKCPECKIALPKYTYLILRRSQKFLLRGKQPL